MDHLDLFQNNMHCLPNGAFHPVINLKYLTLKKAGMSEIFPEAWEGLDFLEFLYLQDNKLNTLPTGAF